MVEAWQPSSPYGKIQSEGGSNTWTDYGLVIGGSLAGILGDQGAALRALAEEQDETTRISKGGALLGQAIQQVFGQIETDANDNLSDNAKANISSTITDPNFWTLSALTLKGLQTAPSIAAVAIPSALLSGAGLSAASVAAIGGEMSAASVVDELYKLTDEMSDGQLKSEVPVYRQLRADGLDESEARREYNQLLIGLRPVYAAGIGAIANSLGVAGQVTRGLSGKAGSVLAGEGAGLAKRAGVGAAEGGVSEAVQSGHDDYQMQSGAVAGGLQEDVDYGRIASVAGSGAVLGAVLGTGAGAAFGGHGPAKVSEDIEDLSPAAAVPEAQPGALAGEASPPEPSASGNSAVPGAGVIEDDPYAGMSRKERRDALAREAFENPEAVGVPRETVQKVNPAGLDAEKTLALAASKPVTSQGNPNATAEPRTDVAPVPATPETIPSPADVPPSAAAVVGTPSISENIAQEAAPAPTPTEPAQARPEPAMAEPAPIQKPSTPRVLPDLTQVPSGAMFDSWVGENLEGIREDEARAAKEEAGPQGAKLSKAQIAEREATNEKAGGIFLAHPPAPGEALINSKKPAEQVGARTVIKARASAMVAAARDAGIKLPEKYKTGKNSGYTPEVMMLMEARRLASIENPSKKDYQQFLNREDNVRRGAADLAIAERREAGDIASRQQQQDENTLSYEEVTGERTARDEEFNDKSDDEVVERGGDTRVEMVSPEAALAAKQEAEREAGITKRDREAAKKTAPEAKRDELPARVQEAVNAALEQAAKKPKAPVVEKKAAPKIKAIKEKIAAKEQKSTPEVTPKVTPEPVEDKSVKARVERAREETNPDPTPAQAETGNYAKGKVSIHGNEISIETPKGVKRKGVDNNGRPWSVTMPVDYGYLNGTKGADGEPIDVFVGPEHDASYVYVIDQQDADTSTFDEHKVMMGFKSDRNAENAYLRSFSDERGDERLGSMTKMTMEEFKRWKNTAPKEGAGASINDVFEARSAMRGEPVTTRGNRMHTPEGMIRDPISGMLLVPTASRKGAEVLATLDLKHLEGAPRSIAQIMITRLRALAGNVDIHYLSPEQMDSLPDNEGALGLHTTKFGHNDVIYIRDGLSVEQQTHVAIHEMVHAATVHELVTNTRFQFDIQRMMDRLVDELEFLSDADIQHSQYALSDVREFVSEAMSNPEFQRVLKGIKLSERDIQRFGLTPPKDGIIRNAFDFFLSRLRHLLKLPDGSRSLLEAAVAVTNRDMRVMYNPSIRSASKAFFKNGDTSKLMGDMQKRVEDALGRRDLAPQNGTPRALWFRTLDSIERTADRYFGKYNPIRAITAAIEGQRVQARKEVEKALRTAQPIAALQNKYKGKVWDDFAHFIREETNANVYADRSLADNKHLSNRDEWAKAQHPKLQRQYDLLPQDLKDARKTMHDYYRNEQNRLAFKTIRNRIVELFDAPDPDGLATRIHEGKATEADKTLLGDSYDLIKQAGSLSKIDGPYVPLMRRGDFVVKGRYSFTKPTGAKELEPNAFEFTDEAAATKWAQSQGPHTVIDKYFVDKNTGERNVTSQGKTVRVTENDFDAVPRWRATIQDRHMEMFPTMNDARARVAELRAQGIDTDDAVPREYQGAGIQLDALSTHVRKMIDNLDKRAEARGLTDEQRLELRKSLAEGAINLMGSTRIQSRNIARRNVAGASVDHVRNMVDYGHSMGNQIAKLDHRPKIDKAINDAKAYVKDNAQDGLAAGRQAILNEVMKRVTERNPMDETKGLTAGANRLLAASFIDKLASPSYSVVNAMQPMMTTTPYLAARYGIGRAVREMGRAYDEIGSLAAIKEGIKQTGRNIAGGRATINPLETIMARVKDSGARQMLEILRERGILGGEQGLEVSDMLKKSDSAVLGKLDAGLSYAENVARHMPQVVEDINRSVSALAAYRLEMSRSGDQARAVQFAHDTVNRTQFNYSHTNTAPWMRSPLARMAFQFKKYGVGMYQLLGEQVGMAIRNENPGDRATAIRTLSYTIAMHGLMAGAMGLPVEPLKLTVMAANAMGVTDWTWKDVEAAEREALVDLFGQGAGEIIARGAPRALGIDLSSRVGLDSLLGPFGEPKSDDKGDIKAFLFDNAAGAPVGLVGDWFSGASHLMAGEFGRAAEKMIPLKAAADSLKAYRQLTEGTISPNSGKQVMSPYSAGEAIIRSLGFSPARESESFERSGIYYKRQQAQEDARTEFQKEWVAATPAAKGRLWREVVKWNKTVAPEARLTITDMRSYQKRLERDKKETVEGIRAKKREQTLIRNIDKNYDFLP